MGVSVYQNTFAKLSGNGTQTITGLPFQPKAVIFWHVGMTGTSFLDGVSNGVGFSDGTNACSVSCTSNDNTASSVCSGTLLDNGDKAITLISIAAGVDGVADLTSFTSDGFTLEWTQSTATTYTIHYLAIGGTDITNVKVGVQTVAKAVTGNKSYTGVGFQPDFLLTLNNGYVKASAVTTDEGNSNAGFGISAMKSTTERWAISTASEGLRVDSDTWRYQDNDKCFALLNSTTGTLTGEADFVSFDSDGFTWNYTVAGTNITNSKFIYLAIKGGVWDVGDQVIPATNITQTTNTNASSTLKGFMSFNTQTGLASMGVTDLYNLIAIGGSDGTRQSVTVCCDNDGAATMTNARIQKTTNCMYQMVANATAASSTVVDVGTVTVPFGTSSFAITYTNTDGNLRTSQFFAVSELSVQNNPVTISEPTVDLGTETAARLFGAQRPISDTAVSVDQTLARIIGRVRSISDTPTITVSETLGRVLGGVKTISDTPSITVNQTLDTILTKVRSISDTPTITVSETIGRIYGAKRTFAANEDTINNIDDTIVRVQQLIKIISESPISTSDSVQGALTFIVSLVESRIKWYYSLLTRKVASP